MIIGYLVYVKDGGNAMEYYSCGKRTVYATWEKAMKKANILAEEAKKRDSKLNVVFEKEDNTKDFCDNAGTAWVYSCVYKGEEKECICISPVYAEDE